MLQRLAFHSFLACLQVGWFLWDISLYSWYYDMRLHDFEPLPLRDSHFKRIAGRWKFLTVWTGDVCALQSLDALVAACVQRRPNQWLQCLCLVMASYVILGLPTGPPLHMRATAPNRSPLWLLVGDKLYLILGVLWNLWCHGLLACMQVFQAWASGGIDASSIAGGPYFVGPAMVVAWALFSEIVVNSWANRDDDGKVQFPYGSLMQMPLRPAFYIVSVVILCLFVWAYLRLGIICYAPPKGSVMSSWQEVAIGPGSESEVEGDALGRPSRFGEATAKVAVSVSDPSDQPTRPMRIGNGFA